MGKKASLYPQQTPAAYYLQLNNGNSYPVPAYILQNMSKIAEETGFGLDTLGVDRSPSPPCSASCQQKTQCVRTARQLQYRPQSNRMNSASSNSNAARANMTKTRSTRSNVLKTTTQAGDESSARRAMATHRPSQTSSATFTRCPSPSPRSPITRPCRLPLPPPRLPRLDAESTPAKHAQTYSVKKPLPYKATSASLRPPPPRPTICKKPSSPKNVVDSSCVSPSTESLFTFTSDSRWPGDVDDDINSEQVTACQARSKQKLVAAAAVPRTPTPKPSLRQLKDVRIGRTLVDQRQRRPKVGDSNQMLVSAKARCYSKNKSEETGQVTTGSTIRSHSSPSEHSVDTYPSDEQQQQQQQQQTHGRASQTADGLSRHVHIARKSETAAENDARHHPQQTQQTQQPQQEQHVEHCTQTSAPMSSASQASIASSRRHQIKTQRQPPATASMSTLAVDTGGRCVMRPVPVAPSGPAGQRRGSRIPRPKGASRPSISVTSTLSKCSSVDSLRPEFNYARPMPIERIPFSKFGLEYIVPLARQEVSVSAQDAFSITGLTGRRKRHLPITARIEDLWEKVSGVVTRLPVATAQFDGDEDFCTVSIITSAVARPVCHTATQTHKSVSLTTSATSVKQRKKNTSAFKEKVEKPSKDKEDYSSMLVRLVQLLYLQTRLGAGETDKNNSSSSKPDKKPEPAADTAVECAPEVNNALLGSLQKQERHYVDVVQAGQVQQQQYQHRQLQAGIVKNRAQSADSAHGPRVYRIGSSMTQPPLTNTQADGWSSPANNRNLYFDPRDNMPWSSNYRGHFAPNSNYTGRRHSPTPAYNRHAFRYY